MIPYLHIYLSLSQPGFIRVRGEGERQVDIWGRVIQAERSTMQRPMLGVFREPQGGQHWKSRVNKW